MSSEKRLHLQVSFINDRNVELTMFYFLSFNECNNVNVIV